MISRSIEETREIARRFLNKLVSQKDGAVVVGLFGDLGAGKTAFTQALAKELGVKRKVNSPTFVIMKKYPIGKAYGVKHTSPRPSLWRRRRGKFKYLFHLDAYRLKNEKELLHLGWEEIISNPKYLVFIEWPENIKKAMPKKHHQIHISHTKEGHRKFKIKKA